MLISVQTQPGWIKQLKLQWIFCSAGPLMALTSPERPIQSFLGRFDLMQMHYRQRGRKEPECAAVQFCKWVSRPLVLGWQGDHLFLFFFFFFSEGRAPGDKIMKWGFCRRQGSFLGRTLKHKKAAGGRAGRGKCRAIKSTFSIVTQGDMWWMRSQLWWLKGADQTLLGFILSSLAVCKETFASCHKRLRPLFYGVQTRRGMSIHSSCLASAATGSQLISPLTPCFALNSLELS